MDDLACNGPPSPAAALLAVTVAGIQEFRRAQQSRSMGWACSVPPSSALTLQMSAVWGAERFACLARYRQN